MTNLEINKATETIETVEDLISKTAICLYLVLALVLCVGCVSDYSERVYQITYTNGDKETITHIGTTVYLSSDYTMGEVYDGCVHYMPRNAHGRSVQVCGVRSIKLISYKEDFH